jgi:hypothetical protein
VRWCVMDDAVRVLVGVEDCAWEVGVEGKGTLGMVVVRESYRKSMIRVGGSDTTAGVRGSAQSLSRLYASGK